MIRIIDFEKKFQPDFKRLNLEWLDKYDLTEQYDLDILDDPFGTVIMPGGCIFLAVEDDKVIGSAGLAKISDDVYELVKMSVDPASRGKGIGRILLERCLEAAAKLGAKKISLFSNSKLQTALTMYEKYGFRHVPVSDSHLLTADVKMELSLSTN